MGAVKDFIVHHYRHFNAADLIGRRAALARFFGSIDLLKQTISVFYEINHGRRQRLHRSPLPPLQRSRSDRQTCSTCSLFRVDRPPETDNFRFLRDQPWAPSKTSSFTTTATSTQPP